MNKELDKKIDLALYEAHNLLDKIPDDPIVLKVNAMANYEKGNTLEAIQLYTKSININPNDYEALGNICLLYSNIGYIKNAIKLQILSLAILISLIFTLSDFIRSFIKS